VREMLNNFLNKLEKLEMSNSLGIDILEKLKGLAM